MTVTVLLYICVHMESRHELHVYRSACCYPGTPGYLKFESQCVCVYGYTPGLLLTSSAMWSPYIWVNKLYNFHMAAIVSIISEHDLKLETYHRNQPNKIMLALYKLLLSHFEQFLFSYIYISNEMDPTDDKRVAFGIS